MINVLKHIFAKIKKAYREFCTERYYYNWVSKLEDNKFILNTQLQWYRDQCPKYNTQIIGFYNELIRRHYTRIKPPK